MRVPLQGGNAVSDSKLLDRFLKKCPFAVLTQVAVRGVIGEEFDRIFEENRSQQYERTLAFSAMATAVADVVLRFADNFRQAYATHKENLSVSLTSFYNKINATELQTSEAIVARSAERAAEMQDQLGFSPWEVLPGYNVYALDGNHLTESDKRLQPLRLLHDAPLPGTAVVRLDLQRQLFDRAYLLEDAHAQESTVLDRVLEDLQAGDVVMADRHYCILRFLSRADEKGVYFLIRQHGRFKGVLVGKRRKIGRTATGTVYEQMIKTTSAADALVMRRITVELDKQTRDGETVIHLLTNLPGSVDALAVADAYRHRWEEETAFFYVTTTLTCELASVGNPQAALFLFSMAMMAFNIRQVVFAALGAEHGQKLVNELSHHALSVEVSRFTDGMLVVLDDAFWKRQLGSTIADLAKTLRAFSREIDLKRYRKTTRGPKKQVIKPPRTRPKTHVSTAKILNEAHT
jgi:IS4 transposase